ncbi:MAG: hypothetical protein A2172_01815 [Candidatus Woykebacteria bacterium RBG_13_40_15]|uniref:Uncharacterized protein n=1 Tax=Candidatus Woykebacteria bacterium RBG_13_40_15 TaxID=1802593 RepID=A0A1G1W7S1_9BACT|nr:MAG: hypothetical protein A2172_01815 [Candidatus Woykebacteria bacterium RBG_13_40_15]
MIKNLIIESYENNLEELSPRRRLHYLVRRYRITGEEKYVPLINSIYKELLPRFKKVLESFSSEEKIVELSKKALANYEHPNLRRARRFLYYQKNPKVMIYGEAILYMFFIKSFGMENSTEISKEYEVAKSYMGENNVSKIFLDKKYWTVNPSECVNIVNFLYFLGVEDERDYLIKLFREYWLNLSPSEPSIWLDKIYALTHSIIGESNYYQNFVNEERFSWAFKYFEKDFDDIIRKVSIDCIGEIGICYKLAGESKSKIVKQIQDLLIKRFDKKLGYIPNDSTPTLAGSEHRNVIATMVLEDFGKLYKGPNLSVIS